MAGLDPRPDLRGQALTVGKLHARMHAVYPEVFNELGVAQRNDQYSDRRRARAESGLRTLHLSTPLLLGVRTDGSNDAVASRAERAVPVETLWKTRPRAERGEGLAGFGNPYLSMVGESQKAMRAGTLPNRLPEERIVRDRLTSDAQRNLLDREIGPLTHGLLSCEAPKNDHDRADAPERLLLKAGGALPVSAT